jgi:DNA-binding LacI/PurR family transcriptional regulator
VAPPKAELGRAAAELLLRRLAEPQDAPGPVRRLELLPVLKERGSVAAVAPAGSGAVRRPTV